MNLDNKYVRHSLFWTIYFVIVYINELFVTSDFTDKLSTDLALKTALSVFNILVLKIAYVNYVLYYNTPRWLNLQTRKKYTLQAHLALLCVVLAHRGISYLNWEFIYQEVPHLTIWSFMARILYSFLDIIQVLAIVVGIKYFRLRLQQEQRERELINEKLLSEILHLKSQINPHFLFNMLNGIYSLAVEKSDKTPKLISSLSSMLRYMLYETREKLVPLTEELRHLDDYIYLQTVRFENKFVLYKTMPEHTENLYITPVILFPVIENMFKHGICTTGDNAFVRIDMKVTDDILHLYTENRIFNQDPIEQGQSGIGLSNIRKQLSLLYSSAGLSTWEHNQTFHLNLHINLKTYIGNELYNR